MFPLFVVVVVVVVSLLSPDEADEHAHVVARAVGLDRPLQRLAAHVLVRVRDVRQVDLHVIIKMCI